jgi:hypothetical protein
MTKCKCCGRTNANVPYKPYYRYVFAETVCDTCFHWYVDSKICADLKKDIQSYTSALTKHYGT